MERRVNPVVVIPVYKDFKDWDQSEIQSFNRCVAILNQHPIYLMGPKKLNWSALKLALHHKLHVQFSIESFDDAYFTDIAGYNKLLKSSFFYRRFKKYSHLLIYQLDAYVFNDELISWCEKGFDYIGAPWFDGYLDNSATNFAGVGNGGFSLRNIHTVLNILPKVEFIHKCLHFLDRNDSYLINNWLRRFIKYSLLRRLLGVKELSSFMKLNYTLTLNEDGFWGIFVPSVFKKYKVATFEEALRFSFEVNPRFLFRKNNNKLPFGCHAWLKYDEQFWKEHIKESSN